MAISLLAKKEELEKAKNDEDIELEEVEELEDFDLGELSALIPTWQDIIDVLAAGIGIHYLDKLASWISSAVGKEIGDWGRLGIAYLIYKLGGRFHRVIQMAGFGMLARATEVLLAPHLPGSPSVFKKNEVKRNVDSYSEAIKYAMGMGGDV